MADWQPAAYKDYRWIVADPQLLGGKLAVRGTRLSVALILECLAAGMSLEDIDESFDHAFPHEALPEVLKVASEVVDKRRWAYATDVPWSDVRRNQQRQALRLSKGAWKTEDHPELAQGGAAYVDQIRAERDERFDR